VKVLRFLGGGKALYEEEWNLHRRGEGRGGLIQHPDDLSVDLCIG